MRALTLLLGGEGPDLDAARLEADGEEVLVAGHALELDGHRHALERQLQQQGQRRGRDDLHEPRAAAGREGHGEQPAAGGGGVDHRAGGLDAGRRVAGVALAPG